MAQPEMLAAQPEPKKELKLKKKKRNSVE